LSTSGAAAAGGTASDPATIDTITPAESLANSDFILNPP
jgi:hypothetical protein